MTSYQCIGRSSMVCRIPRRGRVDWICLAVWLFMPFVSAAFYYGVFRLWKLL